MRTWRIAVILFALLLVAVASAALVNVCEGNTEDLVVLNLLIAGAGTAVPALRLGGELESFLCYFVFLGPLTLAIIAIVVC